MRITTVTYRRNTGIELSVNYNNKPRIGQKFNHFGLTYEVVALTEDEDFIEVEVEQVKN